MIRTLRASIRLFNRWIKKQRTARFSQSSVFTLVTKPLWQQDRFKSILGAPLVAALIVGAAPIHLTPNDVLNGWDVSKPVSQIVGYTTEITTDHTYILPVTNLTGISQYFHKGHPGVDFRSPLGSSVVAMDNGVVVEIVESTYGYGRHIAVQQEDGNTALYAHLGLIMVEVGEQVTAGEQIGEIGMTGWSTGPHLHFEVSKNESQINPIPMLSKALTASVVK